ncbi:MAG: hypothetical protein WCK35_16745, partial [Chloroflexota bacterium]
ESNATWFFADTLIQGASYSAGYIQRGDVIKLCFMSLRNVSEDESVTFTLVPKIGNPTVVETAMPDIITDQSITIFP